MSRLMKTPKSIDSRKKKEILKNLILLRNGKLQDNIMQTGTKNAVKISINSEKPSTPTKTPAPENVNQEIFSVNWNCVLVASNKVSVYKDKLNTNSDQKREKFLIRITLAFSIKKTARAPTIGVTTKKSNIVILKLLQVFVLKGSNLYKIV